jgi:hypothetical protein
MQDPSTTYYHKARAAAFLSMLIDWLLQTRFWPCAEGQLCREALLPASRRMFRSQGLSLIVHSPSSCYSRCYCCCISFTLTSPLIGYAGYHCWIDSCTSLILELLNLHTNEVLASLGPVLYPLPSTPVLGPFWDRSGALDINLLDASANSSAMFSILLLIDHPFVKNADLEHVELIN